MKIKHLFAVLGLVLLTGGCATEGYVSTGYYYGPDPFWYPYPYYYQPGIVIINNGHYYHKQPHYVHPGPSPRPHSIEAPKSQPQRPPVNRPAPQRPTQNRPIPSR